MLTLYGIPNCDKVRAARRWLDANDQPYRFHDLRRDGIDSTRLQDWNRRAGWEALLNRRGTTWRQLPAEQRENLDDTAALRLMAEHPTLIKRPVLDDGRQLLVGFTETQWTNTLTEQE